MIIRFFLLFLLVAAASARGGVYFYRSRYTNKVHYVGRTNNFERRHYEHRNKYFAGSDFRMDKFYVDSLNKQKGMEKYYIDLYQPPANKKR